MEENRKIIKNKISKGGRPKKTEEEKKKNRLHVNLSDSELAKVKKKMVDLGYTNFSLLCYEMLILGSIKVEKTIILPQSILSMFQQFGNNLNQLVKNIHNKSVIDTPILIEKLEKLDNILLEIELDIKKLIEK
jgi:hypothetical protein